MLAAVDGTQPTSPAASRPENPWSILRMMWHRTHGRRYGQQLDAPDG
jgi:hypothetical protein